MMRCSISVLAIASLGLPALASAGSLSPHELAQVTARSGMQGQVSPGHHVTVNHYAHTITHEIEVDSLAGAMANLPPGVVVVLDPSLNHQSINGANANNKVGVFAHDKTSRGHVGVAVRMRHNGDHSGASAHAATSGGKATVSAHTRRVGGQQISSSSSSSSSSAGWGALSPYSWPSR